MPVPDQSPTPIGDALPQESSRAALRSVALLAAAVLAIVAVLVLRSGKDPVVRHDQETSPTVSGTRASDAVFERIKLSMAAAVARNAEAARACEHELDRILDREFAEIQRRADRAAEEVSTYQSCTTIIYRLAKEKLGASASTTEYLDGEIRLRLQPALDTFERELDTALDRYDLALRASTVTLATELAQANPSADRRAIEIDVDARSSGDLDKALKDLGISAGGLTIGGAFDVAAILNSGLVRSLVGKVTQLAASIFAKPAATAAGSAVVAAADGPLPVGDALAVLGGIWTGYEVYSTRRQFEREIKDSLANAIPQMKRDVHHQVLERVRSLQDDYQRLQDKIRNQFAVDP